MFYFMKKLNKFYCNLKKSNDIFALQKIKKMWFQEINGNAKFMTPSSLTPRTPISSIDKSFYNPFTVDISLDTTNIPITGAYNINSQFNDNNNPKCKVISLGRSSPVGKRWSLFSLFSPRRFKITSGHQCHQSLSKTEVGI